MAGRLQGSSGSRGILESMLLSSRVRWVAPRFLSGWVWVRGESPKFSHNDALMLSRQLLSSNLMLHEGGASLGLVISDATVALHGGLIGYASADGVGSLLFFWVRLPQVLQQSQATAGAGGHGPVLCGDHPSPVILIVDDEATIRKQLEAILVKPNMVDKSRVHIVSHGTAESALDYMKREAQTGKHPAGLPNWFVFMDNGLPGMSGAEATKLIKKQA